MGMSDFHQVNGFETVGGVRPWHSSPKSLLTLGGCKDPSPVLRLEEKR
jgi:hypothetical protein